MQVTTIGGGLKSLFNFLFRSFDWTEIVILIYHWVSKLSVGTKGFIYLSTPEQMVQGCKSYGRIIKMSDYTSDCVKLNDKKD